MEVKFNLLDLLDEILESDRQKEKEARKKAEKDNGRSSKQEHRATTSPTKRKP